MTTSWFRRSRVARASLALTGFAATLLACNKESSPTEATPSATVAPSASQAATKKPPTPIPDADIAKAVERHFQKDTLLGSDHVGVAVEKGVATLSGAVPRLLAKEHAVRIAGTIRGIRSVIDMMTVTPIARTDDQLKADVSKALQSDLATHPYAIGVVAKDGKVTLTGTADSWQQKSLFADVAKTVPGLKALDNAIVVHFAIVRPDSEIATDVKHRLANDAWLGGVVLTTTVSAHVVHVAGYVASVAQKTRAREDAWVAGVDGVDDDSLIVDWSAVDDQRSVDDYPVKTDAEVAQAVRDSVRLDPRLRTLIPHVEVKDGTVVLSGTVDSASARRAAALDAKDTLGVWKVRNEVLVQPSGKVADADVLREVKRVLADDPLIVDGKSIQVSSAKGKIVLNGTIDWGSERFDVLSDVASVPGVNEIEDGLVVKRPSADIKATIEDRLYWDPMIVRDRVNVAVAPDGVATLTGTVDSWGEVKVATDDAVWGGAMRVVNLLKVRNHPEITAP